MAMDQIVIEELERGMMMVFVMIVMMVMQHIVDHGMKLRALQKCKKRAAVAGATEDEIDEAIDADDPLGALAALIVSKEGGQGDTAAKAEDLRTQLDAWRNALYGHITMFIMMFIMMFILLWPVVRLAPVMALRFSGWWDFGTWLIGSHIHPLFFAIDIGVLVRLLCTSEPGLRVLKTALKAFDRLRARAAGWHCWVIAIVLRRLVHECLQHVAGEGNILFYLHEQCIAKQYHLYGATTALGVAYVTTLTHVVEPQRLATPAARPGQFRPAGG